eukprot:CAMPEP_0206436502 /NCGR_PEP_ID=MMETSP0324_2-20121206/10515_1 /ASSEMBLY_ACC=CAM_ASM_000836 /TAXON_ID=2866 /ORGANISM="Crypthecodinium cohnii, Strain Seligo" /LENGTH=181 /DNA_ID=CAMNT_0053903667 /DNA_START=201 /DNA_END=747 /DNA_ORIENTATION=+
MSRCRSSSASMWRSIIVIILTLLTGSDGKALRAIARVGGSADSQGLYPMGDGMNSDSNEPPHLWDAQLIRQGDSSSSSSTTITEAPPKGGTTCECICGDRLVWHRLIFAGDVKSEKERECEHEICPQVIIPGLQVHAECHYVEDISELTAGTLCQCQCGVKTAWRDRAFYGDVRKEKEDIA